MKDYVKILRARDQKELRNFTDNIRKLQEQGLYPKEFDFPLTMQLELTENCNLKCKHCYNASGITAHKDAMTPEKWIDFSHYLVGKGGIFQCIMSGGEPLLLGSKLFDIMDVLHDDGTSFVLITNGYLLDSHTVQRLGRYRFMWMQVSIDGAASERHDTFRGKRGSWGKAVNGAFEVSKSGIPLTIAHTVTPESLAEINDMCDLAYQLGAGTIMIGEVTPSGRSIENMEIHLNHEERNSLLEKIDYNAEKYYGRMQVRRSANTKNQLKKYQNTPNNGVIIRPNGDIRLDCMTPFSIGNVLKNDFEKVWKDKGISCWNDPKVCSFINSFDENLDANYQYRNYVDKDIYL